MIIRNKKELYTTKERKILLEILEKGIEAVLPENLFQDKIYFDKRKRILKIKDTSFDVSRGRIFVVGGGKAGGKMAEALEKIIGEENIEAGIVNCVFESQKTKKIKVKEAGHPLPDERGIKGVLSILGLKKQYNISEKDFVICLISGGASSLLTYPVDEISLEDKRRTTNLLLLSGADIYEINTVRKHLSKIKGGKLGLFFATAKVISLIISDVWGDDISIIGSGPTSEDSSTFKEALGIIEKYQLKERIPESVLSYFKKGIAKEIEETPEELVNCYNFIIGNRETALQEIEKESKKRGLRVFVFHKDIIGDTKEKAFWMAEKILNNEFKKYDLIFWGGETNPRIPEGSGKGGRIQHFIASSLLAMQSYKKKWTFAGIASDGVDFIFGIGGAIVDNLTLGLIKNKNIPLEQYLENYDSTSLFSQINNSLIKTTYTGTNVGDLFGYFI